MRLVDHYPETLRDIYDKIYDTIAELQAQSPLGDIAFHVTEWIRTNWGGRLLIPGWWGRAGSGVVSDEATLPGVTVMVDPVATEQGRELRAVVWQILAEHTSHEKQTICPCRIASAISERVEAEWSRDKIYIPKAKEVDRAIRDAQIWQQFSGLSSIGRIIQEHDNVSQSDVYRIFRRLQKDKDAREQLTLF